MNEFIVWDKERKRFMGDGEVIFSDYGDLKITVSPNSQDYVGDSTHDYYDESRWCLYSYIGKTDDTPEQNKIYADCSIVEFERGHNTFYAYFEFNKKYLRYDICIFAYNNIKDAEITKTDFFCWSDERFKIIDTIQENKLGLLNAKNMLENS